jgi:acetoin utilization protein AcuB
MFSLANFNGFIYSLIKSDFLGGASMGIDYEGYIKENMQKNPITITPEASFYEARAIIRDKGIRHLPVVDKNHRLVGLITDRDIREAAPSDATSLSIHELHYLLGKLKVSAFMTPKSKLITITPETIIEKAVQLMHDHKIGCLPILEGENFIGIITETDILGLFVDLFGLKKMGTRLTVALEDKPGQMHGILEVIKNLHVNIIAVASPTYKVQGKRMAAVRIETQDYQPVVNGLEKAGYEVLSIDKWPGK